jgi:hypothetical protein
LNLHPPRSHRRDRLRDFWRMQLISWVVLVCVGGLDLALLCIDAIVGVIFKLYPNIRQIHNPTLTHLRLRQHRILYRLRRLRRLYVFLRLLPLIIVPG